MVLCVNIYVALSLPRQIMAKWRCPGSPVQLALLRNMHCRCSLPACYQASRQVTVLHVHAGCVSGLESGLAMVTPAVELGDGQVKHSMLQVSLLTRREQQGLHLRHSRGLFWASSCRCCCSPDLPGSLLANLAWLSTCPQAQELSTARC